MGSRGPGPAAGERQAPGPEQVRKGPGPGGSRQGRAGPRAGVGAAGPAASGSGSGSGAGKGPGLREPPGPRRLPAAPSASAGPRSPARPGPSDPGGFRPPRRSPAGLCARPDRGALATRLEPAVAGGNRSLGAALRSRFPPRRKGNSSVPCPRGRGSRSLPPGGARAEKGNAETRSSSRGAFPRCQPAGASAVLDHGAEK